MPRTARNLYPTLCSFENLYLGWRKARRGKRGQPEVATFEMRVERNLFQLQEELQSGRYRPGRYHSFYIHEPKQRLISAAPFRDRVVHHALCNIIEPVFERTFIHDSYANRVGKGTHAALDRCTEFMRRHRYVLACDVRQYFPSIDHTILRAILAHKIADRRVMWLVDTILAGGSGVLDTEYTMTWFPGDDLLAATRPRGLPIGNLTSQFWANVYLNELDQFIKRELHCRAYLRYVDDFLLFHDDLGQVHAWREAVIERLASLRLKLHEGRAQPRPVTEGVSFLGFMVFPTHRRLRRHKVIYARRHLKRLLFEYAAGTLSLDQLHMHVQGWVNHARYGDTWGLRRAVLSAHALPPVAG
ncbi:MAG: reverse transcriptase domain-containing protein [Anaerolineae bacterium]